MIPLTYKGRKLNEMRLSPDEIKTYEENCKAIEEMATLMTPEQLSDFLHGDYSTNAGGMNK